LTQPPGRPDSGPAVGGGVRDAVALRL